LPPTVTGFAAISTNAITQGEVPRLTQLLDRAALHQHVAGLEMDGCIVELHVDLAGHHHRVIDRIRAMVARADSGG